MKGLAICVCVILYALFLKCYFYLHVFSVTKEPNFTALPTNTGSTLSNSLGYCFVRLLQALHMFQRKIMS